MRGKQLSFGWGMALGFLLLVGVFSQAAEREKVSYNVDWVFYGRDLGWFAALEKGFYGEGGLDVSIVRGFGSGDTVKKVATGANDYANADVGTVVRARAEGMKLKAIGMFHDKSLYVILTTKDKGIQRPKDLEGRTIGIAPGSFGVQLFPALASVNQIDESKVKWVFMDAPQTIPTLLVGKIDATITFYTIYPVFADSARKAGKEPVAILWSDFGLDMYSSAIIATDQRVREKTDQVRRFVVATMKGVAWAVERPEEALDIFMKYNPTLNRDSTRATWEIAVDHLLTPTALKMGIGYMTREKMEYTRDLMTTHAKLAVKVPLEELYTNEFLPKLFPKRPAR